jgi:hypothetical protein
MTTKDWLVEINKWLRKNGYPVYDMRKMTKKEWGILSRIICQFSSEQHLVGVLERLSESVLQKMPLLSTYTLSTIPAMLEMSRREEEIKKIKEQILSAPGEKVRAWAKDKREHPEKYGPPKKLLDRKTVV